MRSRSRPHVRAGRGGEGGGQAGEQRGEGERERRGEVLSHDGEQEQRDEHGRAGVRLQRGAHSQTGQEGRNSEAQGDTKIKLTQYHPQHLCIDSTRCVFLFTLI